MRITSARVMVAMGVLLVVISSAWAHPARMAHGTATLDRTGHVRAELTIDLTAFLLNDIPARIPTEASAQLIDGPRDALQQELDEGRQRLPHAFHVRVGTQDVALTVTSFPSADEVLSAARENAPARFPLMMPVTLQADLPAGAPGVSFDVSELLDPLILTIQRNHEEPIAIALSAGSPSQAIAGSPSSSPASSPGATPAPVLRWALLRYVRLGFHHILPLGPDHILFILGLFFLSPKARPLMVQVTAFTVAHTLTLGLAMYGVVHVSPRIVEPFIALSIAFVAIENLLTTQLKPWRAAVVFGFGLLHGLGFASALMDLGLPRSAYLPSLISFNVGVELGQLTVLALAFAVFGAFRHRRWYRPMVLAPASLAIAGMGLFWTISTLSSH